MRTLFLLAFLSVFIYAAVDQSIENLLNHISGDSIWQNVDTLTTFERFTKASEAYKSTDFLKNLLLSYEYDTVFTQEFKTGHTANVIAIKQGNLYPDQYVLIGAHYDSYKEGEAAADDNGSGTGTLMELARIIKNQQFEKSVMLVFFSGEEIGLLGSDYLADSLYNAGTSLDFFINLDVIGYLAPGSPFDFDCSYNSQSKDTYLELKDAVADYMPEVKVVDASQKFFHESSDHRSFWNRGFTGLFLAEELEMYSSSFNHKWHTSEDILGSSCNSKELMETVGKATALMTISQAGFINQGTPVKTPITIAQKQSASLIHENSINLTLPVNGIARVSLKTLQGCNVLRDEIAIHNNKGMWHFNTNIAQGVYILSVEISSQSFDFKVIIR